MSISQEINELLKNCLKLRLRKIVDMEITSMIPFYSLLEEKQKVSELKKYLIENGTVHLNGAANWQQLFY